MKRLLIFLCFLTLIQSCNKDSVQNIPDEFKSYVDLFFSEAQNRGSNINLNEVDLTVRFGTVSGNASGLCAFQSNTITIDETDWSTMSEERRTWLMFHELGHCVLDRQHLNIETNNGECLSIMKGTENLFECSTNFYSEKWWDYYLNELFDSTTPLPDWYYNYSDYNLVSPVSTILEIDTLSTDLILNNIDLSQVEDYSIDLEFNNLNTEHNLVKFYFGNLGFSDCDICSGTNVRISSDAPQKVYYDNLNGNIQFNSNIKMTIRNIDNNLYFYVNERFIHTFEDQLWSGDNSISTITFSTLIPMRLTISQI